MLALLAAYLVFGEFDESDPAQNGSGADSSTASQTADENNGLSENGATQFQAENTDEEELAKRYYYSQLDENRQMIYRELVQGIAEHQETIITKGGDPDVTAEVYDLNHFAALRDRYKVMSVPCLVMDDGETVSFGKKNISQLLELLGK